MDKQTGLILVTGVLAIAAYFVVSSVGADTNQTGDYCNGDWTDYVNPACWYSALTAQFQNEANTATNELNTILILLAVVVVLVVGLLAFGTQTSHIAGAATAFL